MQKLERVLPIFVFIVCSCSNLLNMKNTSFLTIISAFFWAAIMGLIIYGLIRLLGWWILH
ncbi:hypothetical protein [Leuconostoc palmae]|uniref:hypothetical protein n=1 Tax=Leuconostoc palmae TaxID=501487 RepID=UPI001C7DE8FD|nr:hypothetical protein [Leuconostoc palmae]